MADDRRLLAVFAHPDDETFLSGGTIALTNATLPYAVRIADMGYVKAAKADKAVWTGINMLKGKLAEVK